MMAEHLLGLNLYKLKDFNQALFFLNLPLKELRWYYGERDECFYKDPNARRLIHNIQKVIECITHNMEEE